MGKLVFYCGNYNLVPKNVTVLGSLTATPKEMSDLGKSLRAPTEGVLEVFSNNDNILNGMRVTVRNGNISPADVAIHYFDTNGKEFALNVNEHGRVNQWPIGFFDQIENDLMEIF